MTTQEAFNEAVLRYSIALLPAYNTALKASEYAGELIDEAVEKLRRNEGKDRGDSQHKGFQKFQREIA